MKKKYKEYRVGNNGNSFGRDGERSPTVEKVSQKILNRSAPTKIGVLWKEINYISDYSLYSFAREWITGKSCNTINQQQNQRRRRNHNKKENHLLRIPLEEIHPSYRETRVRRSDPDDILPKKRGGRRYKTEKLKNSLRMRLLRKKEKRKIYHRYSNLIAKIRFLKRRADLEGQMLRQETQRRDTPKTTTTEKATTPTTTAEKVIEEKDKKE